MSELMVSQNDAESDEMPEFNLSLEEDTEQNTALTIVVKHFFFF